MSEEPKFEVASGEALMSRYGLTAANRPSIRLDESRVPSRFRSWIPLAERWGIDDDLIREDCLSHATKDELQELIAFSADDGLLDEWLAGPESKSLAPSEEYVAFTCLRMAADSAHFLVRKC